MGRLQMDTTLAVPADGHRYAARFNPLMIRKVAQFVTSIWRAMLRPSAVPPPPFKASKRAATIMYGVWYGRMTPNQARKRARAWGFADDRIDDMIARATAEPSYWSQHSPANPDEE